VEPTFEIREYLIEGNTIFHDDRLLPVLKPFSGAGKSSDDVEKARSALEKYYHERGYPTVLVNIPRQTVEAGMVRLEVIESVIRRVKVVGNRYFTRERLLREMPAFRPGEILYLPRVKEQIARANRSQDIKVAPVLSPGRKVGTIDVELHVKDKLPLHGSLELNNRSTHTTTDRRLNAMLRYDNLWQREHAIVVQYQTSPEDTDEVKLLTVSYGLPSPWNDDHMIALYALQSDSATATADEISVIGKGKVYGLRYMIPLASSKSYIHDFTFGIDYKDFEDALGEEKKAPVRYAPLHAGYSATLPDGGGQTRLRFNLNFALRQLSSDSEDIQENRARADGNYVYVTADLERMQKLPLGLYLNLSAGAQKSNQALLSNEQYSAGGINTVRGYKENEASGDDAYFAKAQLELMDIGRLLKISKWLEMTPYCFYDAARLELNDPLPGEDEVVELKGAGAGMKGYLFKRFEYQLDWAEAIEAMDQTEKEHQEFHFKLKFRF
jgi:hemolysin activation/secretion protein